ncbi:MAG: hypothetical protein RM021_016345 [Nostoc sp. EkiNYC01]|nr:hypothetical protein [Nostoc sp. EkiNYC01]
MFFIALLPPAFCLSSYAPSLSVPFTLEQATDSHTFSAFGDAIASPKAIAFNKANELNAIAFNNLKLVKAHSLNFSS